MRTLVPLIMFLMISVLTAGNALSADTNLSRRNIEVDSLVDAVKAKDIAKITSAVKNKNFYVDALDKDGWTLLMYTAMYGYTDMAKILIKARADVNKKEWLGWTPLMLAEFFNKTEVALLFIEKGADVNARSDAGWTPLMYAALYNRIDIGKALIQKGADINAKSPKGETALSIAEAEGRAELADILKKAGAR
jgi:ankyrin repeat protein